MITFERVRKLCEERKMSINDLENALGYSKNTLYRLKTQNPGADKLETIADYFDVSTDYLLGRTDKHEKDTPAPFEVWLRHENSDLTDDEKDILEGEMEDYFKYRKNRILDNRKAD